MTARFTWLAAALIAAMASGAALRARRRPQLTPKLEKAARRLGRTVLDDWDALFI